MTDALLGPLATALADRYRIDRELGQGGMATVYLAEDLKHRRKVAIKVLRPELAAVIGAERFVREIQTIAALQHPHILGLIDSGTVEVKDQRSGIGDRGSSIPDPRPLIFVYYVMPFVDGESLRDRLNREKQLPISDAIRLAAEVAAALDYAHRHGVIHRDIKPENILVHDGSALVADFGIALAVSKSGGSRMTETGMSLGTPHYMSPEQAMGEREITARSDVYALGVVTYEMLVGEPPFTGPTAQAIIAKVMTSEPASLTAQRKSVPAAVEDAVLTALSKLPADRFGSAAEFAKALGGQSDRRTETRKQVTAGAPRRPTALYPAVALLLLGLAAVAVWAFQRPATSGPSVYDAVLPDSAPISFGVASSNVSFGEATRNLTVSPAGDVAVYAARYRDTTALWLRSLRTGESGPIPGAVGATSPQFSPDGTRLAYLRGDDVMLVPLGGGEPRQLLQGHSTDAIHWISPTQLGVGVEDGFRFSWVDVTSGTARDLRISRCPASQPIAGSPLLLCSYNHSASILDPEKGTRWTLRVAGSDGSPGPVIAGTGFVIVERKYLVYFDGDGVLVGARFNLEKRLVSRPTRLLTGIRREVLGEGQLEIAASGTLVYAPGVDATFGHLVKLRSGGVPEPLSMPGGDFGRWDLSRDGRWLAVAATGRRSSELRIYDLLNHQETVWAQHELVRHVLWSPDGRQLMYGALDSTRWRVRRGQPGSAAEPVTLVDTAYESQPPFDPIDWHDDHLAITQDLANFTISRFDPSADQPVAQVLVTGGNFGSVSPNGKLLSYQTFEVNRIMVTSLEAGGRRWQVASNGVEPLWLSGTELLFRLGFSWYKVVVNPETGEPKGPPAFWARDPRFSDSSGWSNRPSGDGGIIYLQGPEQHSGTYLRVIPNWVTQMKAAVDAAGN